MSDNPSEKKILVVEDEPDLLEALKTAMSVAGGFEVVSATDGEEALEVAMAEKPDLILLDLGLPKLDGRQVLSKLREDSDWGSKVPVSILTAQSDLSIVSESMEIGGTNTNYLTKTDWSLEKLVGHVNEVLGISE